MLHFIHHHHPSLSRFFPTTPPSTNHIKVLRMNCVTEWQQNYYRRHHFYIHFFLWLHKLNEWALIQHSLICCIPLSSHVRGPWDQPSPLSSHTFFGQSLPLDPPHMYLVVLLHLPITFRTHYISIPSTQQTNGSSSTQFFLGSPSPHSSSEIYIAHHPTEHSRLIFFQSSHLSLLCSITLGTQVSNNLPLFGGRILFMSTVVTVPWTFSILF